MSCLHLLKNRLLSTPSLWARIHSTAPLAALSLTAPYMFHPIYVRRVKYQAEAIQKWLHRSGGLPLYISVGLPVGPHIPGREEVDVS